ncbi:o-succinylbenzoate--CoA ligase [Ktedonospora formicarum]|uniref:2-succinylbenzoate--CoA ligase n=1 Tax=Ktedonospora formicarum TaxID=2778364 RepID=A0A8J3HZ60_9CHLR|nr:o-succinylbenzoate--CoA ligase [Ktedonospora formicarum]GHO43327.1 2-succinylbenzoate--CoA ligase [Ktedonospora formicarum]
MNAPMPLETSLPNWLVRAAENQPDHLAIQCGSTHWSFAELLHQTEQLAYQLATPGIGKGTRVALLAANDLPFVVVVHALMRLGAILVPLNVRLTQAELAWQLEDVQATFLCSDARYGETASQLARELPRLTFLSLISDAQQNVGIADQPLVPAIALSGSLNLNDIQSIMYTSGTTGHPKGVLITYGMLCWGAIGSALTLEHHADDCWLACLPLFHVGGLTILMRSVINGISVNLHEKAAPEGINRAIIEDGVTIISVVAVILQRMLDDLDKHEHGARYPATLRCVLLGGGPAPRPLLERCAARGIPVVQTYGLTESCAQAATLLPGDALRKLGSAGRPLFPVQLRIFDEHQQPVALGQPGVIHLQGPTITPGYDHRPEVTERAFHNGWFSTGDLGYLDEEGYLYVLDRRSDLIISGGENVYPAEIESVLLSHSEVQEAGVCGSDDARWGQVPIAFVRLRTGSTTGSDELLTYATRFLARYKVPQAIYIVPEIPRNSAGKLLRRELARLIPR